MSAADDQGAEQAEGEAPAERAEPSAGTATPADEETDVVFDTLWSRVEEAWDDDKTHTAILEYAMRKEMLPALAGRYRKVKDEGSDRSPRAEKKIQAIVIALTNVMMAHKTPPRQKVPWQLTVSVGIACLLVVLYVAKLMLHVR